MRRKYITYIFAHWTLSNCKLSWEWTRNNFLKIMFVIGNKFWQKPFFSLITGNSLIYKYQQSIRYLTSPVYSMRIRNSKLVGSLKGSSGPVTVTVHLKTFGINVQSILYNWAVACHLRSPMQLTWPLETLLLICWLEPFSVDWMSQRTWPLILLTQVSSIWGLGFIFLCEAAIKLIHSSYSKVCFMFSIWFRHQQLTNFSVI